MLYFSTNLEDVANLELTFNPSALFPTMALLSPKSLIRLGRGITMFNRTISLRRANMKKGWSLKFLCPLSM
jgi:hypothetical protein